jgi:hypothetical protein
MSADRGPGRSGGAEIEQTIRIQKAGYRTLRQHMALHFFKLKNVFDTTGK